MKHQFADHLISIGSISAQSLAALRDINWQSNEPIGRLALMHGVIEPADIDRVLNRQRETSSRFGRVAVELKLLDPEQLDILLAGQAVRCCVELLEDLALAGTLSMEEGIKSLASFMVSPKWPDALLRIPETAS